MIITTYLPEREKFLTDNEWLRIISNALGMSVAIIEDGPINQRTKEICEELGYYYTATGKKMNGPSYGRNIGITLSEDSHIMILDVEIYAHSMEDIKKLVELTSSKENEMLVFSWERYSKDGASLLVTDQRVDRHGSINSKGLLHNDAWGLSYYPREMAIDAGLYDLDFNGHWGKDDAEFADRVRHAGYNIWWIPEIKFKHLEHDLASWQYPDQDKDRNNSVLRDKSNMPGHQVNTGDLSNLFWVYEP